MVAVVILAMVVFGIFLAFSTGFQGMADARDRTEAVNYIQKALEEYKNTSFNKIQDKPMSLIEGTKFSNGSIVINISEPGEETRLKKIITQVRWTARNGDIKLEEASTLIYGTEKTGELLPASEIILYASPYFRILPNTSTNLFAEIQDANGNIITNKVYTVNFVILDGNALGYLDSASDNTTNGIASVKFYSNADSDGSVTIQAFADLDNNGSDDVFDTIVIIISTGAEGIILVPYSDSSLAGTSVDVDLYVVDASFNYELDGGSHIIPYDGEITLSATSVPVGIGTLSTTTIPATDTITITATDGTASFTLNSNGTPGTVEIIASALDLDIGYTEVTFTGGAESIRLTPIYGSIYEGESIKITITILDENNNPTPYSGLITMASDNGGSFDPVDPIGFVEQSSETVNFSHNAATVESIEITATGGGLTSSNSIYIDVLESLTPSYIELKATPSNVKAGGSDFSIVKATIYDDSVPSEIVTNYNGIIYFNSTLDGSYFDYYSVELLSDDGGKCHVNLYSTASGDTTLTAEGTEASTAITIQSQAPNPVVEFYSDASGLRISSSKSSVVANGVDYTRITVEIIDDSHNVVSDYIGNISLSTDEGYFEGETGPNTITLSFDNEGSKFIKLYSNSGLSKDASITAEANYVIGSGFEATASDLTSMVISWTGNTNLDKIEIMSPLSTGTYYPIIDTTGASSPHTEIISTTLYSEDSGNSTIRLTFSSNNAMKGKYIYITFHDNEGNYPITVYVPQ
jgi:hypothetical protein